MNVRRLVVALATAASTVAVATPAGASGVGVGSCTVTTYYAYVDTCTLIPTGASLSFSCSSVGGATGTITVAQDVFSNVQPCPVSRSGILVVPGVPITVTLRQDVGAGWLEGRASA